MGARGLATEEAGHDARRRCAKQNGDEAALFPQSSSKTSRLGARRKVDSSATGGIPMMNELTSEQTRRWNAWQQTYDASARRSARVAGVVFSVLLLAAALAVLAAAL